MSCPACRAPRILEAVVAFALALAVGGCPSGAVDADGAGDAQILGVEVTENSEVEKFDLSGDGKADVWKFYSFVGEANMRVKARTDRDFNFDGNIDSRQHFDERGVMVREELDLDFDGKFDRVDYFEEGKRARSELAFSFDAKPTMWKFYEEEKLVRREQDTTGDGRADTFEVWEGGVLMRVGYDRDADGVPDYFDEKAEKADKPPTAAPDAGASPPPSDAEASPPPSDAGASPPPSDG